MRSFWVLPLPDVKNTLLGTQFVGFLAAHKEGGMLLGLAAAAVTLWATFAPCFLWIFAGAPYIDWISHQPRIKAALIAITAAVVGVILNLSIWFALHVFFSDVSSQKIGPVTVTLPDISTLDWRVVILTAIAGLGLLKFYFSVPTTLLVCAAMGLFLNWM